MRRIAPNSLTFVCLYSNTVARRMAVMVARRRMQLRRLAVKLAAKEKGKGKGKVWRTVGAEAICKMAST